MRRAPQYGIRVAVTMPDPLSGEQVSVLAPHRGHVWVEVYPLGSLLPEINEVCAMAMGGRGLLDLHMVDCREAAGELDRAIARMDGEGEDSLRAAIARPQFRAGYVTLAAYRPTLTVLRHAYGAALRYPTGRFEVTEVIVSSSSQAS